MYCVYFSSGFMADCPDGKLTPTSFMQEYTYTNQFKYSVLHKLLPPPSCRNIHIQTSSNTVYSINNSLLLHAEIYT